jgi:hypothetical protein
MLPNEKEYILSVLHLMRADCGILRAFADAFVRE